MTAFRWRGMELEIVEAPGEGGGPAPGQLQVQGQGFLGAVQVLPVKVEPGGDLFRLARHVLPLRKAEGGVVPKHLFQEPGECERVAFAAGLIQMLGVTAEQGMHRPSPQGLRGLRAFPALHGEGPGQGRAVFLQVTEVALANGERLPSGQGPGSWFPR